MRKRIVRISPAQAGKVLGVLWGILSIPAALVIVVASAFGRGGGGVSILQALIIPVAYLVFGYIFTAIAAWLYNIIAKWTGGIEFESQEQPDA